MMENIRDGVVLSAQSTRMEVVNAFFRKVYHWMTAGLILTAGVGPPTASHGGLLRGIFCAPFLLFRLIGLEFLLVIAISAGINRMSAGLASVLFVVYSLLNGINLSGVLLIYSGQSVFNAFLTTAGMFGAMSVYGLYSKRDLTAWGSFLTMGLIGLLIAMLLNLFMKSTMVEFVTSIFGVVIFLGLTAWDTRKLLQIGGELDGVEGSESAHKLAIVGALELYLDFINIFLFLLRLFGKRR